MKYVLVDRFLELEAGRRAKSVKCVTAGEGVLGEADEYPPTLVLETILQTGGTVARLVAAPGTRTMLGKVERARFPSAARPGDRIVCDVEAILSRPEGTMCRGVARVDFFWEELGIVGEFDGMGKYGAGDPASTAESVRREKLREDAIRGLGFEVVRWTWAELFRFDVVADRFARAVERARHPHPPTAKTPARCMPRAAVRPARG